MKFFSSDNFNESNFTGNAVCHFEITKTEVETQDFERLELFMDDITSFGTLARQKVQFSFSGYDDDKRELIYIPETVQYAKTLISKYPFFWYYAIPFNSAFFYLVFFLDEQNMTIAHVPAKQSFYIKQDTDDIIKFIKIIAMNLNIYGEEINDIDGSVESLKIWSEEIIGKKL